MKRSIDARLNDLEKATGPDGPHISVIMFVESPAKYGKDEPTRIVHLDKAMEWHRHPNETLAAFMSRARADAAADALQNLPPAAPNCVRFVKLSQCPPVRAWAIEEGPTA